MKLVFKINDQDSALGLGIVEGCVQEGMNQISTIELVLVSEIPLSESACMDFVGAPCTLAFGDLVDDELIWSRFDGKIYEFHVSNGVDTNAPVFKYQAIVRPMLWDLNFMVRARSFLNKRRTDAIAEVLKEWEMLPDYHYETRYFKESLYPKLTQILQNQVSDLVFIQNLLGEAGINYFFNAAKEGNTQEMLKLVDYNPYLGAPLKSVIPYNPYSGMLGKYRVEYLDKHYRSSPNTTLATATFGDGSTQIYAVKKNVTDRNGSTYCSFGCEGEEKAVAQIEATKRAQYFQAGQVTYEGRSNHFALRPGEKVMIGESDNVILLTEVFHRFKQTVPSALSNNNCVSYENLFFGVKKDAPIRPDQTSGKTIVELKRLLNQRRQDKDGNNEMPCIVSSADQDDLGKRELLGQIAALKNELAMTRDLSGLMVGEVMKDAWLTERKELVCKVKNERFPQGLTVKVALGWLTQQGWLSLLPRKGVQVYFQFLSGEGGQNEAVLVGYRPTSKHTTMNPIKTTETADLKANDTGSDSADKAVDESSFFPLNKHRNALLGENGVAEIAVIDGGENSVYLHANNRISAIGDKSVNISTASLRESAAKVSQQFGQVERKVEKNQKVAIKGDMERTVDGTTTETTENQVSIKSSKAGVDIHGKYSVVLNNEKNTKLSLVNDTFWTTVAVDNTIFMDEESIHLSTKNANMLMKEDGEIGVYSSDGTWITLNGKKRKIVVLTGDIAIMGDKKVEIIGDSEVSVKGSKILVEGEEVIVNSTQIKLNC